MTVTELAQPMPLTIEDRGSPRRVTPGAIVVALVNNMPDPALEATEGQFAGLLAAAAGAREVRLRLVCLPEVPRAPETREGMAGRYFTVEDTLAEPPDALIVTGLEPRAPSLEDEPYWSRMCQLLEWAQRHTASSVWSCLAAHLAAQALQGVRRHRLPEKRFGVFEHPQLAAHRLLRDVDSPLLTPHSRWNDLPVEPLRAAGFEILSASPHNGADLFVHAGRSLLIGFQGHPEYQDTTLLKEYRRDVGRFLRGELPAWPRVPQGYFCEDALASLAAFRERAEPRRDPALIGQFPTQMLVKAVHASWRPAAVAIYRNWLEVLAEMRGRHRASITVPV
jgi:homoserine O-succinyltransferase